MDRTFSRGVALVGPALENEHRDGERRQPVLVDRGTGEGTEEDSSDVEDRLDGLGCIEQPTVDLRDSPGAPPTLYRFPPSLRR